MNCSTCKLNKIGPEIIPFGGYFCSNEHLQCHECNSSSQGHCGLCHGSTKFLQMNFNTPNLSVEPSPSKPPSSMLSKDRSICRAFSKQIFEEIESQSRLSEEHLSIKDSRESMIRNAKGTDITMHGRTIAMETLFISATPADNSNSLIGNSDHQDAGKCSHVGEFLQVDKISGNFSSKKSNVKKENVFLFEEDPNDTYIQTSKIRFMDSTESFQNFDNKAKGDELLACASSNNDQQQNSLSIKVLSDFETQNSVNKTDIVKNYLENCNATTCHPPAYNCQHSHCPFGLQLTNQNMETTMKTVSVSTESDPSLKSTCLDSTDASLAANFKPHDYLIMQAVGVPPPTQSTVNIPLDKDGKPSIDMRMQKILETFREDLKTTKFTEKSNFIKLSTQVTAKQQKPKEENETRNFKTEDKNAILITKLLNTHRAIYNPSNLAIAPVNNLHLVPQPAQQEPPLQQFQIVPCSSVFAQELLQNQKRRLSILPVPACVLNMSRSPVQCPESTCQRMIFVSNFNKHLVVDHSYLPMERIIPYQCKNCFLDARLAHCGISKCHLLYLMRDKITDLGSSEYKDLLPILVMTTRLSLNEMCGLRDQTSSLEFFLIWVTGITPEEFPISVSLAVWSRSGRVPSCHVVYSGQMYSIRESQRALDVWQSGRMLLLSAQEIDALTCGGQEMLHLQLSVH